KEMQLPSEEAIFVGDTLTDIGTGKEAGIDTYALPTGFHSKEELSRGTPKRMLRNLGDLTRVVKNPLS
ncbi:MAG: HAD family hydrolase, partial [Thermodesulfobacteriota bacterium]